MIRLSCRSILLAVAVLTVAVVPIGLPAPADAHPVCSGATVTGDRPGVNGSPHSNAFDGNEQTPFYSSYDNWQYVRIDVGCVAEFSGIRRRMGFPTGFGQGIGISFSGDRDRQGEAVAFSVDGRNWDHITHDNSSGWEANGPYASRAWHSVEYGWSDWLRLDTPVDARYVLFRWDGDGDLLYEVDIDLDEAPPLRVDLDCLPGEPVCDATPTGGHSGGYTFNWSTTGVANLTQTDSATSSILVGTCFPGNRFTMRVSITDSHGRTVTASRSDRCAPFQL